MNFDYLIGLVIEEITEEVETVPSANHKSSSTNHSPAQPKESNDISKTRIAAKPEVLPTNSEHLEAFKNNPEAIRFVLFVNKLHLLIMIDGV